MKQLHSFNKRPASPILSIIAFAAVAAPAIANDQNKEPLVIKEQGAYAFSGKVLGDFDTASIHCDHGYVEYQIPVNARKLPLLMWHSSSTKTWETTFAGEDGFKNIFLRRGFAEYIIANSNFKRPFFRALTIVLGRRVGNHSNSG